MVFHRGFRSFADLLVVIKVIFTAAICLGLSNSMASSYIFEYKRAIGPSRISLPRWRLLCEHLILFDAAPQPSLPLSLNA